MAVFLSLDILLIHKYEQIEKTQNFIIVKYKNAYRIHSFGNINISKLKGLKRL